MFTDFFYLLRARGMKVTIDQWIMLLEGMVRGLHGSTLTGFYRLCRALLVNSETDFDRFDQVFLEFFKDVPFKGEIPDEFMRWLEKPEDGFRLSADELRKMGIPEETIEGLLKLLEERLKEQKEEHNGGAYWIGTHGRSALGNSGFHPNGMRIGGRSMYRSALAVAGERRYRDFRRDATLDPRQFQTAFRSLRQFSELEKSDRKEFDVDATIHDTCENGGLLKVRMKNPRKNVIKLILLMDSGGSMYYYSGLCSALFSAAVRSNHFKELHTWYFHNCIYDTLYEDPSLSYWNSFPAERLLQNFDSSYRVIIVGDAAMNPSELRERHYNMSTATYGMRGIERMEQLKAAYPYLIWLNPEPYPQHEDFWSITHLELARRFPMYDLSVDGLEKGLRRLMAKRA